MISNFNCIFLTFFIVSPLIHVSDFSIHNFQDVNDEIVAFDRQTYQFRIPENLPRSESIGYINATNPHRIPKDQSIIYWIGEGNSLEKFWINPKSGELVLTETVDRDPPASQQVFQLRVCCLTLPASLLAYYMLIFGTILDSILQ